MRGIAPLLLVVASCSRSGAPAFSDGGFPADSGLSLDAGPTPPSGARFCDLQGEAVAGASIPAEFCIRKFADLKTPRVLAFASNGDLFVASPSRATPGGAPLGLGGIYVLPDDNRDGRPDAILTYLAGADMDTVHGLAFAGGQLLFSLEASVVSVPHALGDRSGVGKPRSTIADLSDDAATGRWTHTLAVGSDGEIYVSRGQFDGSACPAPSPRLGSVLRIGPGHDPHGDLVSSGFRNPMYLRCAPWGACFAAELSGDGWTGIGGHEKLVELHDGDDFGYPCCVEHGVPVPDVQPAPDCSRTGASISTYTLHDTPFGFDWEVSNKWPAPYTGGFFIGLHGSFFEGPWLGTRVAWAPLDPLTHHPTGDLGTLVSGFGPRGPIVGRVADIAFAPDGRLFFSDDQGGAVYWIAPVDLAVP
jgi:glucose/arabinose dehydrogenase